MEFVLGIIALSTFGWLANNWIRARHGYALEDEWGGKTARPGSDDIGELRRGNAEPRAQPGKPDAPPRVLERIVADKGYDVAQQIEALRNDDPQGAGMPLVMGRKENA